MNRKGKLVCTVLLILGLISCSQTDKQTEKAPISVETERVHVSQNEIEQTYVGLIEEREATAVSFTGMGVVRRLLVSEGQFVHPGQLLAEMDDTQARNLLEGAQASATQAEDALMRYRQLHDEGSMTEAQWVEVQSKVAQARASLASARKNLADCRLTAPVGGIVGRKLVGVGETALPSQAVVTILDISSVKVKVSIPEGEINGIQPRTASFIHVEAADKEVQCGLIEKGVQADALTHTYDIRINVPNADGKLLPGMVAKVTVGERGKRNESVASYITVPVTAVQQRVDGTLFVWSVANEGTAHRTTVRIGETTGNRVVISSGLTDGQCIVTEGYQKLSEGTEVVF